MPQWERVELGGRDIYIVSGRISQTVNICTAEDQRGKYDWIIRLTPAHFVSGSDVTSQPNVPSLITWLTRERLGRVEQFPPNESQETTTPVMEPVTETEPVESGDSLWVERAMQLAEICIDELVREFLELPYLHRVEHSVHTRLYSILSAQPHFDRHFPLAESDMLTQPIHKEWPETIVRPEKSNRRGNFDLVILSPARLRRCSLSDFSTGNIVPPIAIEMGLNYGEGHLAGDAEKLLNSKIQHAYLVHLVRELSHDPTIDETIERLRNENTVKVAFARYEKGRKYLKLLGERAIHEVKDLS